MNEFTEFVNSHRAEAFEINLNYDVIDKLQEQQQKLQNAESSEEILQVREFAQKAVKSLKAKILKMLRNEIHKTLYVNVIPPYLPLVRMWFEYEDLYKGAGGQRAIRQPKKLPEFDEFFDKSKMNVKERNEFKRKAKKDFIDNPEKLGAKIAEMQKSGSLFIGADRTEKCLTNFLKALTEKSWNKSKNNYAGNGYKENLKNLEMNESPDTKN